ncbi:MAG: hypothetical protein KBT27_09350 [Prevotellaceae bacterium]|nr:hypothetical protein [Candidatus Faecinaster equi]
MEKELLQNLLSIIGGNTLNINALALLANKNHKRITLCTLGLIGVGVVSYEHAKEIKSLKKELKRLKQQVSDLENECLADAEDFLK